MWNHVLDFVKGDDAVLGEDEMKTQIEQAARKFMEAGRIFKLSNHKSGSKDYGMWKLVRDWQADWGETMMVSWYRFVGRIKPA